MSATTPRIFISYSSQDAALVEQFKDDLKRAGVDVWLDHEQLKPGEPDWQAAVRRGIEQATTVLYAASPDAADSKYVGHELAIARDDNKTILLFWIRGEKWSRCAPMGFYYWQHIDGRDEAYAAGLASLRVALGASPATEQFPLFQERRRMLLDALHTQVTLLERLGMTTAAGNMRTTAEAAASDTFKVVVVGEYNRGKSTFVNALLGQKALPIHAIPIDSVVYEVRWGDEPAAYVYHFKSNEHEEQRIEQVPLDDFERYLIPDDGKPLEKLVLTLPLDLCRDGVELVDAPGLSANPTRQGITVKHLKQADAVIFVVACDFPIAQSEKDMIQAIRAGMRHEDIFFICNRINMLEDDEQAPVKRRLTQILSPMTRQGERRIYFVDARGALRARIGHDDVLAQASGVPAVERDLKEFIATERGRIKLVRPAHALQDSVRQAREAVQDASRLLMGERLEELKAGNSRDAQRITDIDKELRMLRQISAALDAQDRIVADLLQAYALNG